MLAPPCGFSRWFWWAAELSYSVYCDTGGPKSIRLSYRRWKSMEGATSFKIEQQNLRALWGPAVVTLVDVEPDTALVYRVSQWALPRHPGAVWRVR